MSYIALARQWRPRIFSQLIGQEHVTVALLNALKQQRWHHAYLFTGTRGVGKTSIARLLAKTLNCEAGISAEPCLTCDTCLSIEQGRSVDLIEIDGASKTRVEDTRELLDNVLYAPTHARFKIYLIDEVHMLSQHSFNALLKTLEEPPAHVKFLLATTDPQKIPVTVLSRCLQFNLKPLTEAAITTQLQHILTEEKINYQDKALQLIARAAQGSMRDALSLLDQAILLCGEDITEQTTKAMLGHTQQPHALELLQALSSLDAETILNISQNIATQGESFQYVLDELLRHLHELTLQQHLKGSSPLCKTPAKLAALASSFTPEDLQLFYQIGLKGLQDIQLAPSLKIGFEMTLLRMLTFRPATAGTTPPLAYQQGEVKSVNVPPAPTARVASSPIPQLVTVEAPQQNTPVQPAIADEKKPIDWLALLPKLNLTGLTLTAATAAELVKQTQDTIVLAVASQHRSLFTDGVVSRLEKAITTYFNHPITLKLEHDATLSRLSPHQQAKQQKDVAMQALNADPVFQALQKTFSGTVVDETITAKADLE